MEGEPFTLFDLFRAIESSGARALLIGRQALVLLGLPLNTVDIDLWLHTDDIETLNRSLSPLGLAPSLSPDEARARGRYVLENDERVDVLIARAVSTAEGERLAFDEAWRRRQRLEIAAGLSVQLPAVEDLIRTKRFGRRPHDAEDIRALQELLRRGAP